MVKLFSKSLWVVGQSPTALNRRSGKEKPGTFVIPGAACKQWPGRITGMKKGHPSFWLGCPFRCLCERAGAQAYRPCGRVRLSLLVFLTASLCYGRAFLKKGAPKTFTPLRGHSSSFSTDMNASWGTSTLPSWRMRFLPSFCFSSSFFFRVMSPP